MMVCCSNSGAASTVSCLLLESFLLPSARETWVPSSSSCWGRRIETIQRAFALFQIALPGPLPYSSHHQNSTFTLFYTCALNTKLTHFTSADRYITNYLAIIIHHNTVYLLSWMPYHTYAAYRRLDTTMVHHHHHHHHHHQYIKIIMISTTTTTVWCK